MLLRLLEYIRNKMYWINDKLHGGIVCQNIKSINYYSSLDFDDQKLQDYQAKKLNYLTEYAKKNTKFYSEIDKSFLQFPIIDKSIIKENSEDILSDKYKNKQLFSMSTSGSTGTPFTIYQNINKKKCVNAEIIKYSNDVGYNVGSKLIFLRAMTKKSEKTKLKKIIQNEELIDIGNLSDDSIKNILAVINKKSQNGAILLAYASTYDAIRDYILKYNLKSFSGKIKGIISSSEMLFDNTREVLEEFFNCKVTSRYSNQENGVLGQDIDLNNAFYINESNYYIEIFDLESDTLLNDGEFGRIVVTDLHNFAMPMIRYDTGDVGSIEIITNDNTKKRVITNFGGRKIDLVYNTEGKLLSPHVISNLMWDFQSIDQFQFIQVDKKKYVVKVNSNNVDFESTLYNNLMSLLGKDALIKIEHVKEVPVLSSGKRKYIINQMTNIE